MSRVFFLFTILTALLVPRIAPAQEAVHVILYHRVGDARYPSTDVSVEAFRTQLQWLADNDYHVVSTADLEAHLLRDADLPERPVVIQFDDGYRSVYENAFPILREHGYPFTVFLPTDAIDRDYGDYVTWAMAREMAAAGGSIGAHGVDHLRLGLPAAGESGEAYRIRIRRELRGAADRLRKEGFDPRWVAYPYGEYNDLVLAEARDAGYALGFSQDPGAVGPASPTFRLPRFAVVGTLADMKTFRARMGYGALALAELRPPPGILENRAPAIYGARVVDPAFYGRSPNLFVSEAGRLEASYDPGTGVVSASGAEPLTRRLNRVLVSLRNRETGRFDLTSWLILKPEE